MKNIKIMLFIAMVLFLISCSQDKKEWKNTLSIDSIQVYEKFIDKYPGSVYVDSANYRIWTKVKAIDSIKTYEKYLNKYPSGAYADSAKNRLNNLIYTQGKLVKVTVSFSLDEAVRGKVKQLYYEGALVLKKDDGKEIKALCPIEIVENIRGGQMLEVEFDKELINYKVVRIIEEPK
jgi:hypothetical protein